MLSIEGVLQQPDHIFANCVLGCKPLCPRQEHTPIQSGLFHGEAKCQAKVQSLVVIYLMALGR